VKAAFAGHTIQPSVTITTANSATPPPPAYTVPYANASSPNGPCSGGNGNCCSDTPPDRFNPTEPFGLMANGDPVGDTQNIGTNQGYNCAPINNQYFVGWTNIFTVGAARVCA